MAAAPESTRKEKILDSDDAKQFRASAFLIIQETVKLKERVLLDEILHSIFFLGRIYTPRQPPEVIVNDKEMLEKLKKLFPRPFEFYSSQLPQRSPFSCVLDMIVTQAEDREDENQIIRKLQEFIRQLSLGIKKHLEWLGLNDKTRLEQLGLGKVQDLVSSTICVSQIPNSVRYYGVSMSTKGRNPGRIMVAASCLKTWDSCVANAVMTYYPQDRMSSFDGTLQLEGHVRCQAFRIRDGSELPPCKSCQELFGLETTDIKNWPYGNCAEAESLSNLFKKEEEFKKNVQPANYTEENRTTAESDVQEYLEQTLRVVQFKWTKNYYVPQ
ncbi:uncharacterized protein [Centroberyx affinis]|uniref:uncharacterized protein n=1 Tax=Centroberyx affinis TaxID=166261 RepID=UPI003A5C2FE3